MNIEAFSSIPVDFTKIRPSERSVPVMPKIERMGLNTFHGYTAVETHINGLDSCVNIFLASSDTKNGGFGNVRTILDTQTGHLFALKTVLEPDLNQFSQLNYQKLGISSEALIATLKKQYGNGSHDTSSLFLPTESDKNVMLAELIHEFEDWQTRRHLFELEAQLHTNLDHPNIVKAYRFSKFRETREDKETKGMLMELIEGPSLKEYLSHHKLDLPHIKTYTSNIADACIYLAQDAHPDLTILHNDLKPANILLEDDVAKITDFGLATGVFTQWHENGLAGSPLYMPPERIKEQSPTIASNTYAIGLLVYEMFTNKPLFYKEGDNTIQTLGRILNHDGYEDQIMELDRELYERGYENRQPMIDFIRTATQKEPEDRFQSFEALLDAFNAAASCLVEATPLEGKQFIIFDFPESVTKTFTAPELEIMNTQVLWQHSAITELHVPKKNSILSGE